MIKSRFKGLSTNVTTKRNSAFSKGSFSCCELMAEGGSLKRTRFNVHEYFQADLISRKSLGTPIYLKLLST